MVQPNHDSSNITHNHKVALDLAARGIRVFPCRWEDGPPGSDGHPQWRAKSPMPRVKWTVQATTDIEIINAWWLAAPLALVGMPLEQLNMVVLDPDRHPGGPDGVAAIDGMAQTYPGLLEGPYVKTPQGLHYFFLQPTPRLGNAQGSLPPGINVRGDGGYVIAPGSQLPDGKTWQLIGNLASARQMPRPIIDMINGDPGGFRGTASETKSEDASYEDIPRQAAYLAAVCKNAYDKVAGAQPGNRNNMLNIQAVKLGHFVPRFLTEREAVHVLTEAAIAAGLDDAEIGPTIRSGLSKGKSEPRDPFDTVAEFWDGDIPDPEQPAPSQDSNRIWKGSELTGIPRQRFLIDGLIPEGTLGLMIGESQTFKSFMAQSMALAIAAGLPDWQGHAIAAPPDAITLYIAGEGGIASAAKRMEAWAHANNTPIAQLDRFRVITWPINLMDKVNLKQLVQACRSQIDAPIALIIVDTINTAIPGADENSAQDMGTLYAIMRRLSSTFHATIMGVHHTNRQGKTRGSNALTQNADFWLFMRRSLNAWPTMNVELVIGKLKDEPSGDTEHYHLDLVALPDGSTSLTPKRIGAIQAERTETTARGRPSSRAEAILDVLRRSRRIEGETKTEIYVLLNVTEAKEKRAVAEALRRLEGQGAVTRDGSKWQIVGEDDGFFD